MLPLALAKVIPLVSPKTQFGFLGISYVTFRALDIVFCLRDGVIARPGTVDLFMFLFFFPTISAGPIDRYRRFAPDWRKTRSRAEFLADLDGAVHHFFRGLLYKFILAALIEQALAHGRSAQRQLGCAAQLHVCLQLLPVLRLRRI